MERGIILKKNQAEIGIEFYEKYSVPPGKKPTGLKLWQYNPKLWEEREMCFWAVKRLKEVSYA